jgi:hypothetical protein
MQSDLPQFDNVSTAYELRNSHIIFGTSHTEATKVKLSLCLTKHHSMKMYGRMSTSAQDGGEWSASSPSCFTPGTHLTRGWLGPRAGLDEVAKNPFPLPGIEILSSSISHCTD